MKLTINGEPRDIDAATVAEALAAEGLAEARVATCLLYTSPSPRD